MAKCSRNTAPPPYRRRLYITQWDHWALVIQVCPGYNNILKWLLLTLTEINRIKRKCTKRFFQKPQSNQKTKQDKHTWLIKLQGGRYTSDKKVKNLGDCYNNHHDLFLSPSQTATVTTEPAAIISREISPDFPTFILFFLLGQQCGGFEFHTFSSASLCVSVCYNKRFEPQCLMGSFYQSRGTNPKKSYNKKVPVTWNEGFITALSILVTCVSC